MQTQIVLIGVELRKFIGISEFADPVSKSWNIGATCVGLYTRNKILGRKMTHYRARVAIKRYMNLYVLAYAVYDNDTGGVVLADNCSMKNFYLKRFWDSVHSDLKVARRMNSAGHKLEPLWGHISDRGTWEYRGEDHCGQER